MNYQDHFAKHVRLAILRFLDTAPGCRANSSILHSIVDELGLTSTRDQVKTELTWLEEQRLVSLVDLGHMLVATLTERGSEVAGGRATVPGVQRPTPRG